MSLPISPSAMIGAAGLAARSAAKIAKGSIEAVVNFADVLAPSEPEPAAAGAPESAAIQSSATETLRTTITDLLRQFGISAEQPIAIGVSDIGGQVTIASVGSSDESTARLSELQTSINANEPLRNSIVPVLRQLPGSVFTITSQ